MAFRVSWVFLVFIYCYTVTLHRSVSLCLGMSAQGYIIFQKVLSPAFSLPVLPKPARALVPVFQMHELCHQVSVIWFLTNNANLSSPSSHFFPFRSMDLPSSLPRMNFLVLNCARSCVLPTIAWCHQSCLIHNTPSCSAEC